MGQKTSHQILKNKLTTLWKNTEDLSLIDLGADFYLIKFTNEDNLTHVFHDGPWFVSNHWLFVRKWEQKFVASQSRITHSAIWIRLPELPTKFYDLDILYKVGSKIGTLLKIDACTSSTTHGRYARLCIQAPLEQPLLHHVYIYTHKQYIHYKGENLLSIKCDLLGHTSPRCTYTTSSSQANSSESNLKHEKTTSDDEGWNLVKFKKKWNQRSPSRFSNPLALNGDHPRKKVSPPI